MKGHENQATDHVYSINPKLNYVLRYVFQDSFIVPM